MRWLALAAMLVAAPAAAQQAAPAAGPAAALPGVTRQRSPAPGEGEVSHAAPINGVVTLFGNQRCPTDAAGNEIVVCQRRSADEQFRVPKELREFQITPQNESWAAKAQGTLGTGVGVSSIGSCSVVGSGGQSGCFTQQARAARAENQARKDEEARIP